MRNPILRVSVVMLLAFALLVLAGCDNKPKLPPIAGWQSYQNPYFKVQFRYPQGWYAAEDGGSVKLYTSQEAALKFFERVEGVEAEITFAKMDSAISLASYMNSVQNDRANEGYEIQGLESRTLDGADASVLSYRGALADKVILNVNHAAAMKDTMLFNVKYSGLNDQYAAYKAVFDTLMASVKLPRASAAVSSADPSLPATDFVDFDNKFLKVLHPSNFNPATPSPKGETQFSLELSGYRKDCTIRVDVLPAKGLTVDKVVAQNAGKFKGASAPKSTTISGESAMYLNYSPAKDISSRAYFAVKNDKVYRIILNYFSPMREDFLPVFEKVVASIQIK